MDSFTFVVQEGTVIDAALYAQRLRELGVSTADMQSLRVRLADVAGTRRAILHINNGTPVLVLRPLAPAPQEIIMSALPIPDERTVPEKVGPDSGWQQTQLALLPSDEGLLADAAGNVVCAIMRPLIAIHESEDPAHGICAYISTHPHTPRSVALDGVVDILRAHGVCVHTLPEGFSLGQLHDSEVWVVDPVYGVRLVESWVEYGTPRSARLLFERAGVPSHREVNEARAKRAATF